jgi:small multidrug resistance family-3 protein
LRDRSVTFANRDFKVTRERELSMGSFALYIVAAIAEIGGCFAFWAWLRLGKSVYWTVPGLLALVVFALLLSRIDVSFAGRAYAAYGGVYIIACLVWLWIVEGTQPDGWDLLGASFCLIGAAIILFGPRTPI